MEFKMPIASRLGNLKPGDALYTPFITADGAHCEKVEFVSYVSDPALRKTAAPKKVSGVWALVRGRAAFFGRGAAAQGKDSAKSGGSEADGKTDKFVVSLEHGFFLTKREALETCAGFLMAQYKSVMEAAEAEALGKN